jgi:hypothetical protein
LYIAFIILFAALILTAFSQRGNCPAPCASSLQRRWFPQQNVPRLRVTLSPFPASSCLTLSQVDAFCKEEVFEQDAVKSRAATNYQ